MASHVPAGIRGFLKPMRELSVRREVLAILLILAETMIIYVFAGILLAEYEFPYAPLSLPVIFVVLLIARLIPHVLSTLRIWTPEYETIMAIGIVTMMLLVIKVGAFPDEPFLSSGWLQGALDALILQDSESIRPVWTLIAFVTYAWWRGKTRAEASLETAYTMLRFGMVWLAMALVFTVLVAPPGAAIYGHINAALIGFVIVTLLTIAIARQPEGTDEAAWNASWIWLLVFLVPVLVIAGTSISTVGVLTRDTFDLFMTVLSPLFWLIQISLQAIILTIAVVAFLLVSPLLWLLERQGFSPLSNFPNLDLSPGSASDARNLASTTLQIENPVRYLIVGIILLGLIWVLVRFSFKRRRRWEEKPRQQRESLIDWNSGANTLLDRARSWLAARIRPGIAYAWNEGPEWESTRRVRRTYQRFLRANRRQHFPRIAGETPSQYAMRLREHYATSSEEIDTLTRSYNVARYSGVPASEGDAIAAEQAFAALQEKMRE
jgi:hypothetical protein